MLKRTVFVLFMISMTLMGCEKTVDSELAEYAALGEDKRISIKRIYLIAERDYTWATILADKIIDCRDDSEKTAKMLTYLKDIKVSVEKIDMPDAYDVFYRKDTPFSGGSGSNNIRQPLIIMLKDESELVYKLAKYFDIGNIRHQSWNYKDTFLGSLIVLLENYQLSKTKS